VSRKVDPHAVGRNRIKRVLRDAFRHVRDELPRGDYVLVARPGASRCSGEELRAAFLSLLKRAAPRPAPALPATAAPGTMPAASPSDPMPDPGPG
jgi:ribonuclease P protein component